MIDMEPKYKKLMTIGNDLSFINMVAILRICKKEFKAKLTDNDIIFLLYMYDITCNGSGKKTFKELFEDNRDYYLKLGLTDAIAKTSFKKLLKLCILYPTYCGILEDRFGLTLDTNYILDKYRKANKWF